MGKHRLSTRAKQQLREIWLSIASDSPRAATALLIRIRDKLTLAADNPLMGVARPELGAVARVLIEGHYVIIYEPMPYGVLAVAIVHGMRDPENWLD